MSYAVSSSLGGFVVGKLLGLVNYNIVAIGNLIIHIAVMLFLIVWEREPNHAILFIVPFIWGFCFGAWLTITISKFLYAKLYYNMCCVVHTYVRTYKASHVHCLNSNFLLARSSLIKC